MSTVFDPRKVDEAAYQHLDLYINNFAYIRNIQSRLLCGDPSAVDRPWISIIVPTFQRRQLLEEALRSVLRQEDPGFSWECIVADNTPLDEHGRTPALDVVEKLADHRILYYQNSQNLGPGYNWNRGVELSRGEWVSFLHDDDVLYPDALQNLGRIIESQSWGKKPLGYIHARQDAFSSSDELATLKHHDVAYFEHLTRFRALIRGESGTGMPSCGTAVLRQAYLESGGINYDFGLTADAVLGYQLMPQYRVIVSDRALGAYRWDVNETLKVSSLRELVYSDYLFARYRYSRSVPAQIWGTIFWRAEYNENVEYKIRTGKKKNIHMSAEDFDSVVPYRKSNLLVFLLYKGLQKMHYKISTWIFFWEYRAGGAQQNKMRIQAPEKSDIHASAGLRESI